MGFFPTPHLLSLSMTPAFCSSFEEPLLEQSAQMVSKGMAGPPHSWDGWCWDWACDPSLPNETGFIEGPRTSGKENLSLLGRLSCGAVTGSCFRTSACHLRRAWLIKDAKQMKANLIKVLITTLETLDCATPETKLTISFLFNSVGGLFPTCNQKDFH